MRLIDAADGPAAPVRVSFRPCALSGVEVIACGGRQEARTAKTGDGPWFPDLVDRKAERFIYLGDIA
jgi:hypothetical protein